MQICQVHAAVAAVAVASSGKTRKNTFGIDPAAKPRRRTFTPEYKLRIVEEYDAVLRREGRRAAARASVRHSHIKEWRAARDASALDGLADRPTSGLRAKKSAAEVENEKLRKENEPGSHRRA